MKIFFLACVASLALLPVPGRCQEAAEPAGTLAKVEKLVKAEEIVDVEDEESVDFARMLGDLLEYEHEEEDEEDKDEGRDSRQLSKNDFTTPSSDVIVKYNQFIDIVLNQMSTNMKESVDPMRIVLRKSGKVAIKSDKKKGGNKKGRRKGNKNRNQRRRHPKDLGVEVSEGSTEEERSKRDLRNRVVEEEEDDDYYEDYDLEDEREGRFLDYEEEEEELMDEEYGDEREGKDLKMDYYDEYDDYDEDFEEEPEDAKTDVELARDAKDLEKPSEGVQENKLPGDIIDVTGRRRRGGPRRRRKNPRRRRKRRKGKCNRRCKRIRRVNRRKRKRNAAKRRKAKRGKRSTNRPSAIVSGMSNVRRDGDVRIKQNRNSQNIKADLMVGPIIMEAEKSFGSGPNQSVRKAQAMASEVRGEIVINVDKSGNAKIRKLRIFRPENIQVTGTLKKSGTESSDSLVKNYMTKAKPLIARKMRNSAKKVLRITSNQQF